MTARGLGIKPDRLPGELLAEGVSNFDVAEAADRTGLARDTEHGALRRLADAGRSYYVGLQSAAERFRAAHQRPQAFPVVVDKYLPDRVFGRVQMQFVVNYHASSPAMTPVNSPTGTMQVSTHEVTAPDLTSRRLGYPLEQYSGGIRCFRSRNAFHLSHSTAKLRHILEHMFDYEFE